MSGRNERILIVDDEPAMRLGLQEILSTQGYQLEQAGDGAEGIAILEARSFDLLITDLVMEGVDGMALLDWAQAHAPDMPVIMITGHSTVPSAVEAMQKGAFHYLAKPFRLDEVRLLVRRALDSRSLQRENQALRRELKSYQGRVRIIGASAGIQAVLRLVERIAPTDSPVLIGGETGTGKELIARRLHEQSRRRDKPFITVNSAALPEALLESELFGHVKGAFTGAHAAREGLFQAADGGTIFLDEIGDVGQAAQARLLRVLESGEIRRVGENRSVHVDVRVIAATNRDLQVAVADRSFREDLYYRLNVVALTLPPLRDRREDILPLAEHFAVLTAGSEGGGGVQFVGFTPDVVERLRSHAWPGNVRELENAVRRAVIVSGGRTVQLEDLPPTLQGGATASGPAADSAGTAPEPAGVDSLERVERQHIIEVLRSTGGNKSRAAEILGISRPTLRAKLARYEIAAQEAEPGD